MKVKIKIKNKKELEKFLSDKNNRITEADLTEVNLRWADLTEVNLTGANLRWADLTEADLTEASLTEANLTGANLRGASLTEANLRGANLRGANLRGANLTEANLTGANLTGANLTEANLTGARLDVHKIKYQICPPSGSFVAWKKCRNKSIVKLEIPAYSRRTSCLISRKCRSEFAIVLDIESHNGNKIKSTRNNVHQEKEIKYEVGKIVSAGNYDPNPRIDCSGGIHFFITYQEALDYF